jgi:transcription initiation factor TFIIIB Brf1 subunit/transcription initiation factor TFIIB
MRMRCPNCYSELEYENEWALCKDCGFKVKRNMKKEIKDYYLYLSIDKETGYEGIIALKDETGCSVPAVSDNLEWLETATSYVKNFCTTLNLDYKIVKFKREE